MATTKSKEKLTTQNDKKLSQLSNTETRRLSSTNKIAGLSRLGLNEKSQVQIIQMAISDRSIYNEMNMVFTPPRADNKFMLRFENTYRMAPDSIPNHWVAYKIMERIVNSYVNLDTRYQSQEAEDIARKISVNVKRAVKGLKFPRYKIVATTTIGEKNQQSMIILGKFLWDFEVDRFSTYRFESQYLFVVASVFFIYNE